mmetsp:Transcript_18168/g.23431  ORF Transcript_18168/g.23431 Transcript_18168/m.23431 type:complete len:288 (-) Transcript_18168:163-1026(-)
MLLNHKRKNQGHDEEYSYTTTTTTTTGGEINNAGTSSSVSSAFGVSASVKWEVIQQKLKNLTIVDFGGIPNVVSDDEEDEQKECDNSDNVDGNEDPLVSYLQKTRLQNQSKIDQWVVDQTSYAEQVQSNLAHELKQVKAQTALHSQQAQERREERKQLERKQSELLKELQDAEYCIAQSQNEIHAHQNETSNNVEVCGDIELDRKHQETKLRSRIHMYSACTGIKWNYDAQPEYFLEGYVAVHNELFQFSLDTHQTGKYEIANSLWGILEGKGPPASPLSAMKSPCF